MLTPYPHCRYTNDGVDLMVLLAEELAAPISPAPVEEEETTDSLCEA